MLIARTLNVIQCDGSGNICLAPQNLKSQSNHRKTIRQAPIEGLPTIYQTSISQNCQDSGKSEKLP